jgi:hypothetical protein
VARPVVVDGDFEDEVCWEVVLPVEGVCHCEAGGFAVDFGGCVVVTELGIGFCVFLSGGEVVEVRSAVVSVPPGERRVVGFWGERDGECRCREGEKNGGNIHVGMCVCMCLCVAGLQESASTVGIHGSTGSYMYQNTNSIEYNSKEMGKAHEQMMWSMGIRMVLPCANFADEKQRGEGTQRQRAKDHPCLSIDATKIRRTTWNIDLHYCVTLLS